MWKCAVWELAIAMDVVFFLIINVLFVDIVVKQGIDFSNDKPVIRIGVRKLLKICNYCC